MTERISQPGRGDQPPIVLGTQYGTEVQKQALQLMKIRRGLALRAKKAQRAEDLRKPGAIEELMMPDGVDEERVVREQARLALKSDLDGVQPPQEYHSGRSD